MIKYLICFLLLPIQLFSQKNIAGKIDSVMHIHADFSGVALVADNDKPIYHKAFGYRKFAEKIPLQTSDIFELASVSKQFTAMIIMMLKEKRKLDYDELIEKYLDIPHKGITIRH